MKHALDLHHGRRGWRTRNRRFSAGELRLAVLVGLAGGLVWAMLPVGELAVPDTEQVAQPVYQPPESVGRARFALCHSGGGRDCVVDGDTFWTGGVKIRIADIDTPETHPARCAREAELGAAATRRLHELLNSGMVTLAAIDRDTDRYGRKLRIVFVDGRGVGEQLVAEGLARPYRGSRQPWC